MSIQYGVTCLDCRVSAPRVGGGGFFGTPSLELETGSYRYAPEMPTCGDLHSPLRSLGLCTYELAEREVLVQRLKQDVPGQLGLLSRRMAEAGVNIEVLYSDHDHQPILVVDDMVKGRAVSETWAREAIPTGAH